MEDKYELNLDELNEIAGGYNLSGLGVDFATISQKVLSYFQNGGWQRVKDYALNTLHIPSSIFDVIEKIPSEDYRINSLLNTIKRMFK